MVNEPMQPLHLGDIRFAQVFLKSGISVLAIGQNRKVAFGTDAAAQIFGLDTKQIIDCQIDFLFPETDLTELSSPGTTEATEHFVIGRHSSGKAIPLTVIVTQSVDDKNQPLFSVFLRNRADKVEIEQKTFDDLRLSGAAAKGARIGAFEYFPETDVVNVSQMWRELMNISAENSKDIQREWRARVHPDDLEIALAPITECQTRDDGLASCDYRLRSKDQSTWRWMRTIISLNEKDHSGRVTRVTGAMIDITNRKNRETKSQRIQEQFQSAFENASIGLALVGLDGSFLRVNAALCEFLGYSYDQLLKSDFQSLTHPDDLNTDLALLNELVARKIPSYTLEKRYIRQDGSIVWGLLSVSLIWKSNGQPDHAISQIVDITEQHRLAELKSEFVATISHELRTPLTSILGALSLLRASKEDKFSELAKRFIDIAQQNGHQLKDLINDILDFEKYSSGLTKFDLITVQVLKLIEQAVTSNEPFANKYGVQCEIECADRTLTGITEPKRFNQVMTNLLSNAAKFANQGSSIKVKVKTENEQIKISVNNQGPVIPEEFREHLFEPFLQAENSSTRSRGGTGLGLSIVKRIVEDSGGSIGFESTLDQGTTFWFTVPTDLPEIPQKMPIKFKPLENSLAQTQN